MYDANDFIAERITWRWDPVASTFARDKREEYVHDNFGQRLTYITSYWDASSSSWLLNTKFEYTYPGSNEVSLESSWDALNAIWKPMNRYTAVYTGNWDIDRYIHEVWDANKNLWVSSTKSEYYYRPLYLNEIESSLWDTTGNSWKVFWRALFDYTPNGEHTRSQYFNYDDALSAWVPSGTSYQEWNAYPRPTKFTDSIYDAGTKTWMPQSRRNVDWGAGSYPLSEVHSGYSQTASAWMPTNKFDFNYNGQYSWQDLQNPGSWSERQMLFWSHYYGFNTLMPSFDIQSIYQNGNWQVDGRNTYYYTAIPSSVEYLTELEVSVYPNPVSEVLYLENHGSAKIYIQLLDIHGKRIYTSGLEPGTQGSVEMDVAAGVYLLRMCTESGSEKSIRVIKR
jgi:hypothetical protein